MKRMTDATCALSSQALVALFEAILGFVPSAFAKGGSALEVEKGLWERLLKLGHARGPAPVHCGRAGGRLLGRHLARGTGGTALAAEGAGPISRNRERKIGYTDFKDEVLGVRDEQLVSIPKMTGAQYAKKVDDYLRNHLNHIVIHRLRTNQALTALDLKGLETTLVEIGEEDGETLLSDLLARSEAPSRAHFVRSLVGLDRAAAQAAFS